MKTIHDWAKRFSARLHAGEKRALALENHADRLEERVTHLEKRQMARDADAMEQTGRFKHGDTKEARHARVGHLWTKRGERLHKFDPMIVYQGIYRLNGELTETRRIWKWHKIAGTSTWKRLDLNTGEYFGLTVRSRHPCISPDDEYAETFRSGGYVPDCKVLHEKHSPLLIEAILFYYHRSYGWSEARTPEGMNVVRILRAEGLIEPCAPGEVEHPMRRYKVTERGDRYVEALRRLPYPSQYDWSKLS